MTVLAPQHRRVLAPLQAVGFAICVRVVGVVGVVALSVAAAAHGSSAHARLVRWDANWYSGIAAHGYGFTRVLPDGRHLSDYAFFPLYPMLERAVHAVTGLGYRDSGLVVSWIATAAAIWGVYLVGDRIAGHGVGLLLSGLWATAPVAIVLSMAYSEALFSALAAWALYAVLTRRLLLASVLASLAGLTRPLGVAVAAAVIVAVAMEFAQSRTAVTATAARRVRPSRLVGMGLLAVSGWAGYVAWVGLHRDSLFGYFEVQDGWGNGVDGGRAFAGWVGSCFSDPNDPAKIGAGVLVILGVLCAFGLLALCIHDRLPLPVLVFTTFAVIISFMTARYFASKPRYLLPAFPLLLPVATRLTNVRARRLVVGGATVLSTVYGAIWLLGSGPP